MGNSTNETKPYQVAIVGDSKYGPYAFHIEGHATQKPTYTEAKEGKKAYCHFGFAINDNVWRILGRAEGDENAYSDRENNVFMNVTAFGITAERISKAVDKGTLLMLSGKISHSVFKKRDGNEGESVLITANHFVVIDEGNNMPTSASGVLASWKGKENHMLCGVCGYVKKVGEIQRGQTGESYLRVAIDTTVPVDQTFALANGTYSGGGTEGEGCITSVDTRYYGDGCLGCGQMQKSCYVGFVNWDIEGTKVKGALYGTSDGEEHLAGCYNGCAGCVGTGNMFGKYIYELEKYEGID